MPNPAETDPIAQLGEVLATAERHVQEIVAAAERRADDRLRQAQAQLDARAAELDAIADELLTASAVVHQQLQRLRSLVPLDGAAPAGVPEPPRAAPAPAATPGPVATRPVDVAPRPEPTADVSGAATAPTAVTTPAAAPSIHEHDHDLPVIGGSDHAPAAVPGDRLDSARLVALSMAASGRSRSDVEAHLRDQLGISDYGPLIDYVFGISAPASIVPSWPPRRRRRHD